MNVQSIPLASIHVGARLRALDPAWVEVLAEDMAAEGQREAIRVTRNGAGFVLVAGARRIAAAYKLKWTAIEADVAPPHEGAASGAALRLAEIKADIMRGELTVLERAYYLAAWREVYESVHTPPKRGRKPSPELSAQSALNSSVANENAEDGFILGFSEAAQRALGIGRRSLFLALKIATIAPAQGHRLTGHLSADSRNDLLLLAEQTPQRQAEIIDMLLADEPKAATVTEAVALLVGAVATKLTIPERLHQTFSRLPAPQQEAFFELNAEAIERWHATRATAAKSRKLRSVA